ncbi:MAG: hypothetical protein V4666_08455 [Bacteroidota bacterium]
MPPKEKLELLNLEKFSVAQLPELQGKKEEIKSVIDLNPIVIVTDTETYEAAKKSRTAVRALRTGLEKEQKDVKRKIKERILDVVDKEYDSLVVDVKAEETLRQDSVDVWEAEIEKRRLEKIRLEQERVDGIKKILSDYSDEWKGKFSNLIFADIETVSAEFYESYTNFDATILKEFEPLFPKKVEELTELLNLKTNSLTEAENARLEKEEFEKQKLDLKRKEEIKDSIDVFYSTWDRKILALSDSDYLATLKEFNETPDPDYQEFQDDFTERKERLKQSFIDKRAFLDMSKKLKKEEEKAFKEKEIADRRQAEIDAEQQKLAKEKADFELVKKEQEEKRAYQLKVDGRIQQLVELGLKFDFQDTFVGHDFFVAVLDIKTYDDEKWVKLISDIETKISTPAEEVVPEMTNAKEPVNESLVEKLIPIVEKQNLADLKEAQKKVSWVNIFNDFKLSGEKSLSAWLKTNYNVPTKIN